MQQRGHHRNGIPGRTLHLQPRQPQHHRPRLALCATRPVVVPRNKRSSSAWSRSSAAAAAGGEMAAMSAVRELCGAEKERVVGTHKAPGACPRCGGAVVATDVESERRILGLPLCLKSKRKYSCASCFRRLVTLYS